MLNIIFCRIYIYNYSQSSPLALFLHNAQKLFKNITRNAHEKVRENNYYFSIFLYTYMSNKIYVYLSDW